MNSFLLSVLELIAGIGLLFGGGELFVQGSVALALILGIPQLVIGLTVVSLGTSAPELFVSVSSVLKSSDALAVSNVVGSNIFNVLVVLGSSALILPLKVESRLVRRDVPLLMAVSAAVWGMASTGKLTWQAGVALLVGLIINTAWEIRTAREEPEEMKVAEPEINLEKASEGWKKAIVQLIGGILLLSWGANTLVNGATSAARLLGVSEAVIGLTIVSVGTSMPELITSLVAAIRGRTDLAIGNVVGSSLLNQLLVLSSCAVVAGGSGLHVDQLLIDRDLPLMVLTSIACIPIFWTRGRISRLEGGILLGLYICYIFEQIIPITLANLHDEFRLILLCIILPSVIIIIVSQTILYWKDLQKKNIQKTSI